MINQVILKKIIEGAPVLISIISHYMFELSNYYSNFANMIEQNKRGGKREGAGRPIDGKQKKRNYTVVLEPRIKQALVKKDGSLTKSLNARYKQIKPTK